MIAKMNLGNKIAIDGNLDGLPAFVLTGKDQGKVTYML
jgi:hypothetical protein